MSGKWLARANEAVPMISYLYMSPLPTLWTPSTHAHCGDDPQRFFRLSQQLLVNFVGQQAEKGISIFDMLL